MWPFNSKQRRRPRCHRFRPRFEALEPRAMLACAVSLDADATLLIEGDQGANQVAVFQDNSGTTVHCGDVGGPVSRHFFADFDKLVARLGDGDDVFWLRDNADPTGSNKSVDVDLGAGNNDRLDAYSFDDFDSFQVTGQTVDSDFDLAITAGAGPDSNGNDVQLTAHIRGEAGAVMLARGEVQSGGSLELAASGFASLTRRLKDMTINGDYSETLENPGTTTLLSRNLTIGQTGAFSSIVEEVPIFDPGIIFVPIGGIVRRLNHVEISGQYTEMITGGDIELLAHNLTIGQTGTSSSTIQEIPIFDPGVIFLPAGGIVRRLDDVEISGQYTETIIGGDVELLSRNLTIGQTGTSSSTIQEIPIFDPGVIFVPIGTIVRRLDNVEVNGVYKETLGGSQFDETIRLNTYRLLVGAGGEFVSQVAAGGGNDALLARSTSLQVFGSLRQQMDAGDGNDLISSSVWNLVVHSGAEVSWETSGGAGADRITEWFSIAFRVFTIPGLCKIQTSGGADGDTIRTRAWLAGNSRGGDLSVELGGDGGHDRLALSVDDRGLDTFFALLDGGDGLNHCRAGANVSVVNC